MRISRRHKAIIVTAFALSKTLHLALVNFTPTQFDLSQPGDSLLEKLVRWDLVYFASLFQNGPQFEHEWVFGPLWARLVRAISQPFTSLVSPLFIGLALSNLAQLYTAMIVYKYTSIVFNRGTEMSVKSAVLFLWSPMGIFGTVAYSENFAALMCMLGLYLRELALKSRNSGMYALTSICWSLAFLTRSNCLVLGFIYLYDLFALKKRCALLSGLILGCAAVSSLLQPFKEFCPGRPWCDSLIPSLYSYAQSYYWGVGFLRYWTPNNLFNFALATPILILHFRSSMHFLLTRNQPIALTTLIFIFVIMLFAHVQIIIRISSFLPLQYWYVAQQLMDRRGEHWVAYLSIWLPVQSILYAAFLPPA